MAESVMLIRKDENQIIKMYIGWSWTIFFFQTWPMLFRGNVKAFFGWGILIIICYMTILPGIALNIVLAAKWNNNQTIKLIEQGYVPADDRSTSTLKYKNIIF